mmetsp:Transcript_366/g.831  ORF Transcript_366/g.831 Transcript_366/m.831 type:complete len:206 (-) Transcript_366:2963-3580(-)
MSIQPLAFNTSAHPFSLFPSRMVCFSPLKLCSSCLEPRNTCHTSNDSFKSLYSSFLSFPVAFVAAFNRRLLSLLEDANDFFEVAADFFEDAVDFLEAAADFFEATDSVTLSAVSLPPSALFPRLFPSRFFFSFSLSSSLMRIRFFLFFGAPLTPRAIIVAAPLSLLLSSLHAISSIFAETASTTATSPPPSVGGWTSKPGLTRVL